MITQKQQDRINTLSLELVNSLVEKREYTPEEAQTTVEDLLKEYEMDIKWGEINMLERDMKIYIKYGM
jgi:polyhydroxyalkanoate synthesis regulator phasin